MWSAAARRKRNIRPGWDRHRLAWSKGLLQLLLRLFCLSVAVVPTVFLLFMVHVEVHKVTGAALGPATAAEAGGGYTLRAAKPLRNGIKHTEIRSAKPTLVARGLSSCYGPQAATAAEPEGLLPCRSSVTPCSTWRQFLTFRKISQLGNRNAVQLSRVSGRIHNYR